MFVARGVCDQCSDRGRHRPCPLHCTADDDPNDMGIDRRNQRTNDEQHQPNHDNAFAAEAIGRQAERDLSNRLGQAVHTHGQADQHRVFAARHRLCMHCKYRQDQEQPEHAQTENRGERDRCPNFGWGHAASVSVLGNRHERSGGVPLDAHRRQVISGI